jgi:type I restriction enzyme S subunit
MDEWAQAPLADLVDCLDHRRKPIRSQDRNRGPFPYYGASGVIDHVAGFIFEGLHLLIAEDGENLRTRKTPVAFLADGRFWVNNHAHVVKGNHRADTQYLSYAVQAADISGFLTGSTQPKLTKDSMLHIRVPAPPVVEQQAIAGVLGALDDKIESNRRIGTQLDHLFMLECEALVEGAPLAAIKRMADVAEISLGGTPSRAMPEFWDGGEIAWINSGSLHERPVLTPADFITEDGLARSATKVIPAGATVVAITGATLGVVSRLGRPMAINQSVVAVASTDDAFNCYLYYWMRSNIGSLVSSATGAAQQHVNKGNFEGLQVEIPEHHTLAEVGKRSSLLAQQVALARESLTLASLRDALLPELLSGRLRVGAAEEFVEAAV